MAAVSAFQRAPSPAAADGAGGEIRGPGPGRYNVYLLRSASVATGTKGRTYVGYTVDPHRRFRQHNGEIKGGACQTKRGRPWDMVAIVGGFPSQFIALQFEWAWQHPQRSTFLKEATLKATIRGVQGRLAVLQQLVQVRPWSSCPIRILWRDAEVAQLAYKLKWPGNVELVDGLHPAKPIRSLPLPGGKCAVCNRITEAGRIIVGCPAGCPMVAHITCLSTHCLGDAARLSLIPVQGSCPRCAHQFWWGTIVAQSMAAIPPDLSELDDNDFVDHEAQDGGLSESDSENADIPVSQSQPVSKKACLAAAAAAAPTGAQDELWLPLQARLAARATGGSQL